MEEAAPASAWAIGDAEPPDGLRTTAFYEALNKHCSPGGCAVMSALGTSVASKFMAPTVADNKSNVQVCSALSQLAPIVQYRTPHSVDALHIGHRAVP